MKPPTTSTGTDPEAYLSTFQQEAITFFVHAAAVLSLPKSVGEIYGLFFSTEEPLTIDQVMVKLHMSRGSAFAGMRWLRNVGAVKLAFLPTSRKDHYEAETSLRKLASGFLRDQVEPHVEHGDTRLEILRAAIDPKSPSRSFEASRVNQIQGWHKFIRQVLPVVKTFAAKF